MSPPKVCLTGKLILDSGKLTGSYFDRSVVFVCHHDGEGAIGLVVNRPTRHPLGAVVREPPVDELSKTPLYLGGPVQPESLSFLFQSRDSSTMNIFPWLAWGRSFEEMEELFESDDPPGKIIAFAGYAGWSSGQLDEEMKSGCWIVHPASPTFVFSAKPEALWRHVLRQKGGIFQLIAEWPQDASLS